MLDFIQIMTKPLLACLILIGIHTYLGIHVIQRGVIFVDLALAQVAAFGATIGFVLGYDLHSHTSFIISLIFTFLGASIFSFSRFKKQIVPQEAIIGIIYAVFSAATILILSKAPEGSEELKSLLVGHILFVSWNEILKIFILYVLIGFIHLLISNRLTLISENVELAYQKGINVRLWDFIFYITFGFVVTSSVELAGVLQVFTFLIVPSTCGFFIANSMKTRLLAGWGLGVITCFIGMFVSYYTDLPTGATLVCCFGLTFTVCWIIYLLKSKNNS